MHLRRTLFLAFVGLAAAVAFLVADVPAVAALASYLAPVLLPALAITFATTAAWTLDHLTKGSLSRLADNAWSLLRDGFAPPLTGRPQATASI